MKIFEIRDNLNIYGYLFCNNNYSDYYIEINNDNLNQDVFFKMFLDNNINVINNFWAKRWIEERVIPSNRQNINDILLNNNMISYNELELFIKAYGRSSMDNEYIKRIDENELINNVSERRKKRILDFIKDENRLICFFMNGKTKVYTIKNEDIKYINTKPFLSIFGNEIIFNSKIRYNYDYLYYNGIDMVLNYSALKDYLENNLISQKEICEELNISRQGVNKKLNKGDLISYNNNYIKNEIALFRGNH